MNKKHAAAALLLVVCSVAARGAEMDAEALAKRVGQVFSGYNTFWVWVVQRARSPDGTERVCEGRAYFKRDKKFRLNFGQPPSLVHGTDGDTYWVYDASEKVIRYTDLDRDTNVHPLLIVFAAGGQMVKALDKYFNVEELDDTVIGEENRPAYKLVLSLKPKMLKEMREKADNKLVAKDAKQTWTFWVDKKEFLPRKIQVDWETKERTIFELGKRLGKKHAGKAYKFHSNMGLPDRLFTMPHPRGVKLVEIEDN